MKVTISGNEYAVTFNMAVQIAYEDESGQPFDLSTLDTQKATMQLCYASLKEANYKLPFTFADLVKTLTVSETTELKNAVITAMTEWFKLPEVMKKDEPVVEDGEDQKNG